MTAMPIGGGTFTVQNKVLPGAYINFVSTTGAARLGARGTAALPLELNWGPENVVTTLDAGDFNKMALELFGCEPTSPELLLVREVLKRAKKLLFYRVNSGGEKATAAVGGLNAVAKYAGTRGNDIRVAVQTNAGDETKVDVVTYLGTMEVDSQTVPATGGAGLAANAYVTFSGAQELAPAAAKPLTGGTNGEVTGGGYAAFLTAIEVESFNTIAYPGDDEAVKALFLAFVKRLRYDEGRKIVGVLAGCKGDDIGVIDVKNGVVLADGTSVSRQQATAWVAGASAAAAVNESLTNAAYDGAVDVTEKYTKSQYEAAIQAGEFVFYADDGKARVLTDINSLTSFGAGASEDWSSNRVVRVMDGWANDVARIFGESYKGSATNSDTGRQLFKGDLVKLANQYAELDAISGFVPEDIEVGAGLGKRDVSATVALRPNDSMEKLYMTVTIA